MEKITSEHIVKLIDNYLETNKGHQLIVIETRDSGLYIYTSIVLNNENNIKVLNRIATEFMKWLVEISSKYEDREHLIYRMCSYFISLLKPKNGTNTNLGTGNGNVVCGKSSPI